MKLPRIIGVAGTNGSGKDTLGDILHSEKGYTVTSLSDTLRDQLTADGLEHTRENLSARSKQIRDQGGDGALANLTLEKFTNSDDRLVITSVRTPGEVDEIHAAGGIVVWVDADDRIRYDRIISAGRNRVTDEVSFEEFLRQQEAEMTPTDQGGGLNMFGVKQKADLTIINEFDSIDEYQNHLRQLFEI